MMKDHVVLLCLLLFLATAYARSYENILLYDEKDELDMAIKSMGKMFRKKHSNILAADSGKIPTAQVSSLKSMSAPIPATPVTTKQVRRKEVRVNVQNDATPTVIETPTCEGWCIFGIIGGSTSMLVLLILLIVGLGTIIYLCRRNVCFQYRTS
jgi:hypothetical protein